MDTVLMKEERGAGFEEEAAGRYICYVYPDGGIAGFEQSTTKNRTSFDVAPRIPGDWYVLPDGGLLLVPIAQASACHSAAFWRAERERILATYPDAGPSRQTGYEEYDLHDDGGMAIIDIGDEANRASIFKLYPKTTLRQVVRYAA